MQDIIEQNNLDSRLIPLTRLLQRKEVLELCGIGQTLLYDLIREHKFPEPIKLGDKRKAWVDEEVQEWIEHRRAERKCTRVNYDN